MLTFCTDDVLQGRCKGSCGCPQNQVGWGPGQQNLVEAALSMAWGWVALRSIPPQAILQFYDSKYADPRKARSCHRLSLPDCYHFLGLCACCGEENRWWRILADAVTVKAVCLLEEHPKTWKTFLSAHKQHYKSVDLLHGTDWLLKQQLT